MAVHGSGAGDGEASAVAEGDGPAVADVVWVEIIVLPGVLALTNRSLWDLGFTETIIGSKGSSSSCSCFQMVEAGRAGWCLTLKSVVLGGEGPLGMGSE